MQPKILILQKYLKKYYYENIKIGQKEIIWEHTRDRIPKNMEATVLIAKMELLKTNVPRNIK